MRERTRPPTHPGGILKRHYLAPLGIGITQAAEALGVSRQSLSKSLHEHRAIPPDTALRLAQALHTTPELWLNLQRTYALWHAAHQSEDWRQVQELVVTTETTVESEGLSPARRRMHGQAHQSRRRRSTGHRPQHPVQVAQSGQSQSDV